MSEIIFSEPENSGFGWAFELCKAWAADHQAEVGVAEMALGAAVLSWGVMSGHIVMGHDLAASKLANVTGLAGLGIGAVGAAAIATTFLKGVFVGGVATVAGVTCIPAVAIIGGASLVLGAFGYVIGDKLDAFFNPAMGFADLLTGASITAVGAALIIDGARRIIKDERVLQAASKFKNGIIKLAPQATEIVAATWDELQVLVKELTKSPAAYATAGTTAVAGAAIGSSLAAGSVTVLGSHGLGALALSVGLVSAPAWPIIAGGAAGLALGVAAWKGIKHFRDRQDADGAGDVQARLLPGPKKI